MASANIERRARSIIAGVVLACLSISAIGQSSRPSGSSGDDPQPRFIDPARRDKLSTAFPAIDALMAQRVAELSLPGLAYGIVIDGELVVAKGLGFRDLKSRQPVDASTVFRIASMTKSFTPDAGKLSLEDPIAKHVPQCTGDCVRVFQLGLRHPWTDREIHVDMASALHTCATQYARHSPTPYHLRIDSQLEKLCAAT